ncbi:unnamed protein product, partial [Dibothriocephalus latus]
MIGRYMQMMQLLKPIASEVMHCIGQLFDYYLFVTRFAIPDCIANRHQEELLQSSDLQAIGEVIQRHLVGIESLVFLATILET